MNATLLALFSLKGIEMKENILLLNKNQLN